MNRCCASSYLDDAADDGVHVQFGLAVLHQLHRLHKTKRQRAGVQRGSQQPECFSVAAADLPEKGLAADGSDYAGDFAALHYRPAERLQR